MLLLQLPVFVVIVVVQLPLRLRPAVAAPVADAAADMLRLLAETFEGKTNQLLPMQLVYVYERKRNSVVVVG